MQSRCAGKIHKGLVQRQGFDAGRHLFHQGADRFGGIHVGLHAGLDDDGVRAKFEGLEHRHCRAHAPDPRHIAGRGPRHHAAPRQ